MYLRHIAARMFDRPLLVLPEYAQVMATVLSDRLNVEPMIAQEVVDSYKRPNDRLHIDKRNGIAIMPVVGGTVHRGDGPEASSGVQSYTAIQNKLNTLLDDREVRGILLDIDSGGGEAAGIHELAGFIGKASTQKPIWAIANTTAASAAYWLAASADRVYAAPGARVGSIGVYVQHVDMSKLLEKRGIVTSFIFAGKHKIDGNPYEALPEDVRATMQESVNALWDEFAGYVADQRGLDIETVQGFEAAVFGSKQANEVGLVDGVATLGEVLSDFAGYLNRPRYSGLSLGENMSERLNHSDSDLAKVRAEAHAAGVKEGNDGAKAEIVKVHADFSAALNAMFPESKKAKVFAKAITGGMSIAAAAELAGDIEEYQPGHAATPVVVPSATEAAADALLAANAPNVKAGDDQSITDPKQARLAQLSQVAHGYAAARGYIAR